MFRYASNVQKQYGMISSLAKYFRNNLEIFERPNWWISAAQQKQSLFTGYYENISISCRFQRKWWQHSQLVNNSAYVKEKKLYFSG